MSKMVKDLITKELQSRYGQTSSAIWVELIGIDGIATNQFRRELRERKLHLEVIRNALFRRAVGDGPLSGLANALHGPAALVTGGDSAVEAAKFLEEWLPRLKGMRIRGAVFEGEYLDETRVTGLSKMPTKHDIQARLAASILSPGAVLSSAILSGGGKIAGCLKALIEKREKEPPPATPASDEPAATATATADSAAAIAEPVATAEPAESATAGPQAAEPAAPAEPAAESAPDAGPPATE